MSIEQKQKQRPIQRYFALASSRLTTVEAWLSVHREKQLLTQDQDTADIIARLEEDAKTWMEMLSLFDLMDAARKELEPMLRKYKRIRDGGKSSAS